MLVASYQAVSPLTDRSLGIRVYKPYFSWASRRLSSGFQRRRAVVINLCYVDQYRQPKATTRLQLHKVFQLPMLFCCFIFIHSVVCLTTGPKHLPKRALHIVRSRGSSFKWEYPLLSLRSSSSFLRLLPRLPVTSIPLLSFLQ